MFETLTTYPSHPLQSMGMPQKERSKNRRHSKNMNTQMGSSLPSEKLDRSSYSSWEYKMNQFLVRQGHWSEGANPRKVAKEQSHEGTKPRRIMQQSRAKTRRHKTASRRCEENREQSCAKSRKPNEPRKSEDSRGTARNRANCDEGTGRTRAQGTKPSSQA